MDPVDDLKGDRDGAGALAESAAGLSLSFNDRVIDFSALKVEAKRFSRLWTPILVLILVDWSWNLHVGLEFTGWAGVWGGLAFLVAGSVFYTVTGRNRRLADACHFTGLWVIFSLAGVILTYLAASLSMPLRDLQLSRMDAALGFHWLTYHTFVFAHPVFHVALWIAYASLLPQVIGSTLYFAMTDRPDRNRELLGSAILSAVITTSVFALAPALGPDPAQAQYYPVLAALRAGVKQFSLDHVQGLIQMPSYHAALALVLVYVHRPPARSFFPVLVLNILMLLSTPEGHHYLVDIIAGMSVGAASIYLRQRYLAEEIIVESRA
jgi:hypothetical protein